VIKSKINTDYTYLADTNFWSPLDNDDNVELNDDKEDEIHEINSTTIKNMSKSNKWIRRIARRRETKIIIDSGATSHFITEELNLPMEGASNKEVFLPNNAKLRTSSRTKLPFDTLTNAAREADVLPGLKRSLLSVSKMSDEGYTTIFHPGEEGVTIHKKGTINITTSEPPVLKGEKENMAKLWTISATDNSTKKEEVNSVYSLPSIPQSIRYLHAAAGFPVKETWLDAIKAGNYVTWPGLTTTAVRKHFPDSDETQQGHMKKQRQGVRSTKEVVEDTKSQQLTAKKMHDVYIKIHNVTETMYTDQTGRFPATSTRGNQYIMVLVEVDGNYIDAEPMKNKTEGSIIKAYLALWARLTASGTVRPKTHLLDNEASAAFKAEIKKNCTLQLVPPDNHRRNLAERAIQTFKSHFKAIIAGVADNFPMNLWDRLLPQAVLTLNLLRQSNVAPTVSAYQYVNGAFDYNKMPLAPMGCAVQIHENSERRRSWAANSSDGWYLRTSPEHYRCHVIYCKNTRSERISDTVHFKHKYITEPTLTPEDTIVKALNDLTHALKERRNKKGIEELDALQRINDLLNNIPTTATTTTNSIRRVTFDELAKPPQKTQPAAPRVDNVVPTPRVVETLPTPRVVNETQTPRVGIMRPSTVRAMIDKPILTKGRTQKTVVADSPERMRLKEYLRSKRNTRVRITQRYNMNLRRRNPTETIQNIYDSDTGESLNYRQLMQDPKHRETWKKSSANEFGRLTQGLKDGRVKGTNTMRYIKKNQIPQDRRKDITYARFVCDYRPNKAEPHRTRLTVGGDRINYPDDAGTPTADMTLFKIHANSIISTPGARCIMADIKDFYLNTPMKRPEYMRIKLCDIPEEIIDEYNLRELVDDDGYIYCEITKGMYGLPQAGLIAQELLAERLARHGYHQSKIVPGLWMHESRATTFTLVVDDFAIKVMSAEDEKHLLDVLRKDYIITVDREATKYIGLTIDWDYNGGKVHIHMPGYLDKAMARFKHDIPTKIQNSPHRHIDVKYGAKKQFVEEEVESPPLSNEDAKYIQAVSGTLLYYARAVDPTILLALSSIATEQAKPTENTREKVKQLLDYCATQEDAIITYKASKMILCIHSDAGYANEKNARSRAGGHFFLSTDDQFPPNNGAILTTASIIKAVMSSAAEAELGALFLNAKEGVYLRQILTEMGHPQPRTPLQTDNTTAEGVINNKIQPKRTKAMDMRFHWLRDREAQGQFRIHWRRGKTNLADYFTKHHPPAHHVNVRADFLTKVKDLAEARRQRQTEAQSK